MAIKVIIENRAKAELNLLNDSIYTSLVLKFKQDAPFAGLYMMRFRKSLPYYFLNFNISRPFSGITGHLRVFSVDAYPSHLPDMENSKAFSAALPILVKLFCCIYSRA